MTESLTRVSTGYKVVFVAFLLQVLGIILVLALLFAAAGRLIGRGDRDIVEAVTYAIISVGLLGQIVGLIGQYKCIAIPKEVGATRMIVFSVATGLVVLLVSLLQLVDLLAGPYLPFEVTEVLGPATT